MITVTRRRRAGTCPVWPYVLLRCGLLRHRKGAVDLNTEFGLLCQAGPYNSPNLPSPFKPVCPLIGQSRRLRDHRPTAAMISIADVEHTIRSNGSHITKRKDHALNRQEDREAESANRAIVSTASDHSTQDAPLPLEHSVPVVANAPQRGPPPKSNFSPTTLS